MTLYLFTPPAHLRSHLQTRLRAIVGLSAYVCAANNAINAKKNRRLFLVVLFIVCYLVSFCFLVDFAEPQKVRVRVQKRILFICFA